MAVTVQLHRNVEQYILEQNALNKVHFTSGEHLENFLGKRTLCITSCTLSVLVVFFSMARMRSSNSACMNKSNFTTEKIV